MREEEIHEQCHNKNRLTHAVPAAGCEPATGGACTCGRPEAGEIHLHSHMTHSDATSSHSSFPPKLLSSTPTHGCLNHVAWLHLSQVLSIS